MMPNLPHYSPKFPTMNTMQNSTLERGIQQIQFMDPYNIQRSTFDLETSIANRAVIVHEKDFLEFAKFLASYDILLPKTTT
mmetsp:Transcript_17208/g.25767  ORF Transcript_17208/g.25767 Transcript_17208/m.25767 type:complete len:81 (+) Transcript_17208:56-298(+)